MIFFLVLLSKNYEKLNYFIETANLLISNNQIKEGVIAHKYTMTLENRNIDLGLDSTLVHISNPDIRAKAFKSGKRLLVIATHRKDETLKGEISVPGFKYEGCRGLGEFKLSDDGCKLELPADSLAALSFRIG